MNKDGTKSSAVFYDSEKKNYVVWFYDKDKVIAQESYEGHSEVYHEDAAENYVMGIKKI